MAYGDFETAFNTVGKALLCAMAAGQLVGCVEHRVTAPQLDALVKAAQCPPVPALPPIPQQAHISIEGTTLHADDGGMLLLRSYVAARSRAAR